MIESSSAPAEKVQRSHLGLLTALALLVMLSSPYWCPGVTWVLCIVAGGLSLAWVCARADEDPWLGHIALASYGTRVFLTLALFGISVWHLPIFERVQRGQGFWQIGGDGIGYHAQALKILDAWRLGVDLPSVFRNGVEEFSLWRDMALPTAVLYKVVGSFVLHALLFNAWLGALTVVPAYLLVRLLADRRGARRGAFLIGFWPSFLIWSTQLLKESFTSLAIVVLFYCFALIWQQRQISRPKGWEWLGLLVPWGGVFVSTAMLAYFRLYMGGVLLMSLSLVMGSACIRHVWRRRWLLAVRSVALVAVVGAAVLFIHDVDFLVLLSPRHAEVVHVQLGLQYQRSGDFKNAMLSYIRALQLKPGYPPARRLLRAALQRYVSVNIPLHAVRETLFDPENHAVALKERVAEDDLPILTVASEMVWNNHATPQPFTRAQVLAGASALDVPKPVTEGLKKATYTESGHIVQSSAIERVWTQLITSPGLISIAQLNNYRKGMIRAKGHFTVDSLKTFHGTADFVSYLPRAFLLAFLSPFPSHWFDASGETGGFRPLSSIEVILIMLLLPGMLSACWLLLKDYEEVGQVLVLFSLLSAILLSCVIINMGILFRLRLQYLLPLLIAIGITGLPSPYHAISQIFTRRRKLFGRAL